MGNKRDSFVRLNIRGVVSHKISTFHLLVAGDTIVNFEDINIQAFERVGGKQKKLCARIADNGQDSLLKQVVVSYGKVKSPGSIVDLMIEWCWPNMLNVTDCDYTTLPNFLAGTVKHLKMSLECKEDIDFKSASIYKYKVGMDKDVDFSASLLKVTGKRNKQRLIPFGDELKETMLEYVDIRNEMISGRSDAFFVRENGERLYKNLVYNLVKRNLSKVVTLKKRSPHVLRHTFATTMLNNDAELGAVKELLGHSSLATTEIYTHTTFEELKKVYKQAHPRA